MTTTERRPPLKPGDPAPGFTLSAIDREGIVSLADYQERGVPSPPSRVTSVTICPPSLG
jgi:hypothetical protein